MSITVVEAGDPGDYPAPPVPELPMRIVNGAVATVPQGSLAELRQSVELLLRTRLEERDLDRDYGTPDYLFRPSTELQASDIEDEITAQEPRAAVTVEVTAAGARSHVTVTVRRAEET